MKKNIIYLLIGMLLGSTVTVIGAGIVKVESTRKDAVSTVGYGTSDSGDSIVRFKTESDGTLHIKGV